MTRELGVLLVVLLAIDVCQPAREVTSWVVKIAGGGSRESEARRLAMERGLEFVGPVASFTDIFELRHPSSVSIEHRIINRDVIIQDDPSIDDHLSGHPIVEWVSKQVALKRTKRDFSDPAFPRQWHLVTISLSCPLLCLTP